MAKAKLTLYLDVVSPFGYMAFYITRVRADVITNALSFLIMRAPFYYKPFCDYLVICSVSIYLPTVHFPCIPASAKFKAPFATKSTRSNKHNDPQVPQPEAHPLPKTPPHPSPQHPPRNRELPNLPLTSLYTSSTPNSSKTSTSPTCPSSSAG